MQAGQQDYMRAFYKVASWSLLNYSRIWLWKRGTCITGADKYLGLISISMMISLHAIQLTFSFHIFLVKIDLHGPKTWFLEVEKLCKWGLPQKNWLTTQSSEAAWLLGSCLQMDAPLEEFPDFINFCEKKECFNMIMGKIMPFFWSLIKISLLLVGSMYKLGAF